MEKRVSFSDFLQNIDKKLVSKALLGQDDIVFTLKGDSKVFVTKPIYYHPGVIDLLHENAIPFDELKRTVQVSSSRSLLYLIIPTVYISVCIYAIKKLYDHTSGGDIGTLNSSQAHRHSIHANSGTHGIVTFEDIAGIDYAKDVVREVVDFMKNPQKYTSVGARLPTGILLYGPPGTGKTLLARAMANEAGLPFYYCSGSDFVEVYAGRGASRVRNLFAKASKQAPCVLFFDEIDALGKSRSAEISMNEEREQTLNQLLACMDGFSSDKRVVVIAATNRFDILDRALVRPGRFDRVVKVTLPDQAGRAAILRVHAKQMSLSHECDLDVVASVTPNYAGAELAMIVNEAAIRAARDHRKYLITEDFLSSVAAHKEGRGANTTSGGMTGGEFMSQFFRRNTDPYAVD